MRTTTTRYKYMQTFHNNYFYDMSFVGVYLVFDKIK